MVVEGRCERAHTQPDKSSRARPAAPKRLEGSGGGGRYPEAVPETLTAADARQWAVLTRAALAARRREIDALNVFPVPDGDTGTNLYLTFDSAIDDIAAAHERAGLTGSATLAQECEALRRAMLLSARGNSGVIMSQLVGGLCSAVVDSGAESVDAALLAEAFAAGARAARGCVQHPQEGTILTVADDAARAGEHVASSGGSLEEVCEAAVEAARASLARTPDLLPALARAGVVDAGGAGCVLLLESLHRVVTGSWTPADEGLASADGSALRRSEWHTGAGEGDIDDTAPNGGADIDVDPLGDAAECTGDGPAYEVMFLLTDSDASAVATLTASLDALGDSLIVVGGPDLWNVHVHVDDPGAAVEAGLLAGRPERIRISHFASQGTTATAPATVGVVACAAGPGVAALMEAVGAVVVSSGPGRRASAGQLLDAVRRAGAESVVIIPGDPDTFMAAEIAVQAAGGEGLDVHVLPARTTVQSLAALAVLDPTRSLRDNLLSMTSAAVSTRHGAVTVATKQALTWAGVCQPGDVLGVVDGDVAFLEHDLEAATTEVLERLLSAGGELVTLVVGADAGAELAQRARAALQRERPEVEVVIIDGGQPVYPLLIGVE